MGEVKDCLDCKNKTEHIQFEFIVIDNILEHNVKLNNLFDMINKFLKNIKYDDIIYINIDYAFCRATIKYIYYE